MIDFASIIGTINTYVWYVAFVFLVGLGIYFMIRLKGIPILKIHRTSKLALSGTKEGKHSHTVSSFEAFCIGLGARVGVGNIAGVASAIVVGGPGAVFWMWIFAIIGSASSFMESTLSQLFKEKKSDGQFHSGPAYYALKGLGNRKLAVLLAFLIIITFGIGFVGVQATNSATALDSAFSSYLGLENGTVIFGAIIALAAAAIIFGGVKRIAKFSTKIVPVMALAWFVFCIIVICCNIDGVVHAVEMMMIFTNAFGIQSVGGGALGAVMMMGLKRGVFSNEAGLGSIANIAGTADVKHPIKQGMIQSFGTIVDTLVVCSFTAFVILSSGTYDVIINTFNGGVTDVGNATLVQNIAEATFMGEAGPIIISIFLLVFAFTSLIGYYTMSESNIRFIKDSKGFVFAVRILVIAVAFLSCVISTGQMETICDTFMAAMGAVNMIVVFLLSKFVFRAYEDWKKQEDEGVEDPVFHRSVVQDIADEKKSIITEWE